VHNCTQSLARDILFDSMGPVEDAGYDLILHVHDELVTETPDTTDFRAEHLAAIMSTPPEYAPDIPLAAAGFESKRYRK
jgi:DNA polymerase